MSWPRSGSHLCSRTVAYVGSRLRFRCPPCPFTVRALKHRRVTSFSDPLMPRFTHRRKAPMGDQPRSPSCPPSVPAGSGTVVPPLPGVPSREAGLGPPGQQSPSLPGRHCCPKSRLRRHEPQGRDPVPRLRLPGLGRCFVNMLLCAAQHSLRLRGRDPNGAASVRVPLQGEPGVSARVRVGDLWALHPQLWRAHSPRPGRRLC